MSNFFQKYLSSGDIVIVDDEYIDELCKLENLFLFHNDLKFNNNWIIDKVIYYKDIKNFKELINKPHIHKSECVKPFCSHASCVEYLELFHKLKFSNIEPVPILNVPSAIVHKPLCGIEAIDTINDIKKQFRKGNCIFCYENNEAYGKFRQIADKHYLCTKGMHHLELDLNKSECKFKNPKLTNTKEIYCYNMKNRKLTSTNHNHDKALALPWTEKFDLIEICNKIKRRLIYT